MNKAVSAHSKGVLLALFIKENHGELISRESSACKRLFMN
jgi:hypothetical protein